METCCGCFQTTNFSKKKKDKFKPERKPNKFTNTHSENTTQNNQMSTISNHRNTALERSSTQVGGNVWKSQFDNKDLFKDIIANSSSTVRMPTGTGQNGRHSFSQVSHDASEVAHQSSMHHSMTNTMQNNFSSQNKKCEQCDCISKYYSFQCQKCSKTFKKVITSEVSSSMINLEEALNLPNNTNCECPHCGNQECNLQDVQTLIAGYLSDEHDHNIIEEDDDEEDGDKDNQNVKKPQELQIKMSCVESKTGFDFSNKRMSRNMSNNLRQSRITTDHTFQDISICNNMSRDQSPIPNFQDAVGQSTFIENSRRNPNLLSHSQERTHSPSQNESHFISQLKSMSTVNFRSIKQVNTATMPLPAPVQVQIVKDEEYFEFDNEQSQVTTSPTTTKGQSTFPKSNSQIIASMPISKNKVLTKPDEDTCKTFNSDLMRSLIARKMQKNKTFFEIKIQPQAFNYQLSPISAGGINLRNDNHFSQNFSPNQRLPGATPNHRYPAGYRGSQQITSNGGHHQTQQRFLVTNAHQ
eukprot:403363479